MQYKHFILHYGILYFYLCSCHLLGRRWGSFNKLESHTGLHNKHSVATVTIIRMKPHHTPTHKIRRSADQYQDQYFMSLLKDLWLEIYSYLKLFILRLLNVANLPFSVTSPIRRGFLLIQKKGSVTELINSIPVASLRGHIRRWGVLDL